MPAFAVGAGSSTAPALPVIEAAARALLDNPPVLAAVITGALAIATWLGTWIISAVVFEVQRRRRQRELLIALRAQIRDTVENLRLVHTDRSLEEIGRQFDAADFRGARFVPYSVALERDVVFEQVQQELTRLPRSLIELIVTYFYSEQLVTRMKLDMRSEAFLALTNERRRAVVTFQFAKALETADIGERLDAAISASLRFGIALRVAIVVALVLAATRAAQILAFGS